METLGTLKALLTGKGLNHNTEVTRHRGIYHLLHICRNGAPVPLVITPNASEVRDHIDLYL
ncbi:hypothetical protein LCGC14_1655090 [marine sediment metagenome]|uniref:Uncharacterized protein n=1 Tax=marine sediment metagenome TaxID=412755 RepID=A0A0F9HVS7_9ZZZZ